MWDRMFDDEELNMTWGSVMLVDWSKFWLHSNKTPTDSKKVKVEGSTVVECIKNRAFMYKKRRSEIRCFISFISRLS